MRNDPDVQRLRLVPGFSTLDDRSLQKLVPLVDWAQLRPGQLLTHEGAIGRKAFIVVDGTGHVSVDGQDVATIGPGDFVGEMAMLDNRPRCATLRGETTMRFPHS
jgi:CRP/FNR family cyclic AMP-dependent transcriptional regulator